MTKEKFVKIGKALAASFTKDTPDEFLELIEDDTDDVITVFVIIAGGMIATMDDIVQQIANEWDDDVQSTIDESEEKIKSIVGKTEIKDKLKELVIESAKE